jgi:CxxC motif-containing protein
MSKENEIICIMCPLACRVAVRLDEKGDVLKVADNQCKRGEEFAAGEAKFPGRVLTTTLITEGGEHVLLPVKTNKPVARSLLMDCMCYLSEIKVKPPVKMGQVIIHNILDTGADVVATGDLSFLSL